MSELDLSALEKDIEQWTYKAVQDASQATDRTQQSKQFKIGVSDLGHCSTYLVKRLQREEPKGEGDYQAAMWGTLIGDGIEQAIKVARPDAIIQSEVSVTLVTDQGTFTVNGHPDVILPEGILLDNKGTANMDVVRKYGFEDRQKKYQRHLYAKGAWEAGLFGDISLDQVLVGNLWHDRSATEKGFYCRLEPFSEEVVREASAWLEEVVYAFKNGVEAPKEPSREFCKGYCEYFDPCRLYDTDVEGLIQDPEMKVAAALYYEGLRKETEGKKQKQNAQKVLLGAEGSTGEYLIRWTQVNEGEVSYHRAAYQKISVTPIK